MTSKLDARALNSRARNETQADPRERAHLSLIFQNQRMIRDLSVRGRSISEGKALGMAVLWFSSRHCSHQKKRNVYNIRTSNRLKGKLCYRGEWGNLGNIFSFFFFFYTTNTNLLVHEDAEGCRISALDGERSLFRSLPKNCIEKTSAILRRFCRIRGDISCQTHCVPSLKTTWYVIHTSVRMTCY